MGKDSVGKEVFVFHTAGSEWEALSHDVRPGCDRKGSLRSAHSAAACGPMLVFVGGRPCDARRLEHLESKS